MLLVAAYLWQCLGSVGTVVMVLMVSCTHVDFLLRSDLCWHSRAVQLPAAVLIPFLTLPLLLLHLLIPSFLYLSGFVQLRAQNLTHRAHFENSFPLLVFEPLTPYPTGLSPAAMCSHVIQCLFFSSPYLPLSRPVPLICSCYTYLAALFILFPVLYSLLQVTCKVPSLQLADPCVSGKGRVDYI